MGQTSASKRRSSCSTPTESLQSNLIAPVFPPYSKTNQIPFGGDKHRKTDCFSRIFLENRKLQGAVRFCSGGSRFITSTWLLNHWTLKATEGFSCFDQTWAKHSCASSVSLEWLRPGKTANNKSDCQLEFIRWTIHPITFSDLCPPTVGSLPCG